MQPITEDEIYRFAPSARESYVRALVDGWPIMQEAGLITPLRLCEFLAQVSHETGGFTIVRENTRWSPKRMTEIWPSRFKTQFDPRILACQGDPKKLANLAYSHRSDIGNKGGDDGWNYRGCGFLQDTGRYAFTEVGKALDLDLIENPELLENPAISLRAALWRWQHMNLNRFADFHYTRAIGNAINRGSPYRSLPPIGHADRVERFHRAWVLFGDAAEPPEKETLALGAYGTRVASIQMRLRELGYAVGSVDKVFGPTTGGAVASFKMQNPGPEYEPFEHVGPVTLASLEKGKAAYVSVERKETTADELVRKGSTEAALGVRQKAAGTALVATAGVKAAQEQGALDAAKSALEPIPQWKSVLEPTLEATRWAFTHAYWVLPLLLGVWIWSGGHKVLMARLKAHREGFNLWR